MADETKEQARRIAAELGLDRLDAAQLEQFAKGLAATRDLTRRLPKDLHWSEEPANVMVVTPTARRTS